VFITARQFKQKPRIWVGRHASPGGTTLTARRFLSGTQETSKNWMSRLAAVHRPPGGFWKIPETRIIHNRALYMHQFNHTVHEIKQYAIKGTIPAPLTWNSFA